MVGEQPLKGGNVVHIDPMSSPTTILTDIREPVSSSPHADCSFDEERQRVVATDSCVELQSGSLSADDQW